LLAWEVCEKIRSHNIKCNLITGNEKDIIDGATHLACTVEMSDLYQYYDVAVIDEVQLIGDNDRGWAWSQAILGLQTKELHLCGSPSMLKIIEQICEYTKDALEIRNYERLQPLVVKENPLRSFEKVRSGDAVIGFSRTSLYDIKQAIERANSSNKSCLI
jgi:ATP-dependent RNA helicase SUPV3L1/SUV3